MSQDIISTKYHDQKINAVIHNTTQLNDKYPVLLLPLRLETRYMTVDRPIKPDVRFDYKILFDIVKLDYLFERITLIHEIGIEEAENLQNSINYSSQVIENRFKKIKVLPYPENSWWKKHINSINSGKRIFKNNFRKIVYGSKLEKSRFKTIVGEYATAAKLLKSLEVIQVKNTDFDETARLIDKLNVLDDIFEKFASKSMYYTNKTKKGLFSYIESRLNYISQYTSSIEDMMGKNMLANTTQISRIGEFPFIYSNRIIQLSNNLQNLKSDFKKAEFINKLNNEIKPQVDELCGFITEQLIPKLHYIKKLKTVKAQELTYESYVIEYEIKRIISNGLSSYEEVKSTRTHLYKLMRKLRAQGHDIIVGSKYDIEQLRIRWSKVDKLLLDYNSLVLTVEASNRYEEAGITRTRSHINENYRTDLNGLRKEVPITEAFIQNNDFLESAKSYRVLIKKVLDLGTYAYSLANKSSITKSDLIAAANTIEDFEGECAVLTIKTTIIPEEYYKNIHYSYAGFKQSIEQVKLKVQGNSALAQAMNAINDLIPLIDMSISQLSSDITDENDPFYDDFRKKFIFALETETKEELWVRIYPDDVFVHSHEKAITHDEHEDTLNYWTEVWNGDEYKELELAAWRVLALKYGVNRAVYLRQLLNPDKAQQSVSKPKRVSLLVRDKLESTSEHLNRLMGLDLNSSKAIKVLLKIDKIVDDCLNNQMQFSHEQTFILNGVIDALRQVQLQTNSISTLLKKIPTNQRTLVADFVFGFSELTNKVKALSEELSNKIPITDSGKLPFWVIPDLPQTGVTFKETVWSEAPKASALPGRFVFVGMQEKAFSHTVVGKQIPDELVVGINPLNVDPDAFKHDNIGNLEVDEDIKWMTDFDEAVDKGMGIIVPLTKHSRGIPFEKIMVLGVKDADPEIAKNLLTELIEGHSFSPDGISLLPVGTPTNITETKSSGYTSEEEEDSTYDLITGDPLFSTEQNEKDITDGQLLTESLGLDNSLFEKVKNADRKDIYKASLMNKVMWPATMGYYMEEIVDSVFTQDNINRTYDYFTKHVSGRGSLPGIRIGTQPYGILTTTAFSRFKTVSNELLEPISGNDFKNLDPQLLNIKLQKRFDIRLKELLNFIRGQWMEIVDRENLSVSDFNPELVSSQEHFMQLLGLQATSIEQYFRYNVNSAQRRMSTPSQDGEKTVNFKDEDFFGYKNLDKLFGNFINEGYFIDDTYYNDLEANRMEEARTFRLRYLDSFGQLSGPFVREGDDPFLKTDEGETYIDKMLEKTPYHLWRNEYGEVTSNSLFFLFLRQSLVVAYRNSAFDVLIAEGVINENIKRRAGNKETYILPDGNSDIAFTKWNYLFNKPSFIEDVMDSSPYNRFPLLNQQENNSFWNYLKSRNNEWSMSQYLYKVTKANNPEQLFNSSHNVDKLKELRQLFLDIKDIPIDELERLFAEHMDLCTYRFDAWQLGIANKRLEEQRSASGGKDGIHLGAFGWLEDLKPGDDRELATNIPVQLRENDGKSVYTDESSDGFIHAPSINHATAAAILRSGYIANRKTGDQSNPMAVNLSSKRVRMALNLLEGIRNGQDVAALLGYQMERGLHEGYGENKQELDIYIYNLRRKFPLHPEVDVDNAPDADENRNLLNVLNGTKVLEEVRKLLEDQLHTDETLYELQNLPGNKTDVLDILGLPSDISNSDAKAIFKEIDRMADAYDALGDLLLSESVYHIVQGNHVRSAAVFAALSEGRVPPEVHIINTPRTGHVLTQRMVLQLRTYAGYNILPSGGFPEWVIETNIQAAKPEHWKSSDFSIRAFAEASLNNWIGEMIGDPGLIRCYASYNLGETQHNEMVSIKDLNIQPIDLLFLLSNSQSEENFGLNSFIANYLRKTHNLTADVEISLFFKERNRKLTNDGEDLTNEIKTINEIMPLVSSLFDTINTSRPMAADDYVIPGQHVPGDNNLKQIDVKEVRDRVEYVHSYFNDVYNSLLSVFQTKNLDYKDNIAVSSSNYSVSEIDIFRIYLDKCNSFGISGSIPDFAIETTTEAGQAVASRAAAVLLIMEEKLTRVTTLLNYPAEASDSLKVEKLVEVSKIIFGRSFVIIPHFSLRNFDEIHEVLNLNATDSLMRNADEYAMDSWLQGISKVRNKLNKLEMVSTMTSMFDVSFPEPTPIQLPYDIVETDSGENIRDYWLGLEFPDNYEPDNDKLSLVVLNEQYLSSGTKEDNCCGLLIDDWIEVIPHKEEDTGITFNYDQPDAEPPQSMLLAVTPEQTGNWNWNDLVHTLVETMDLYKARLIEPEQVDTSIFTQVLPAIMTEMPAPGRYQSHGDVQGMLNLKDNNNE